MVYYMMQFYNRIYWHRKCLSSKSGVQSLEAQILGAQIVGVQSVGAHSAGRKVWGAKCGGAKCGTQSTGRKVGEPFDICVSNLYNNRFILLPSYSRVSYYLYTVRTIRLWNSLHNNSTASRTIYVLRRLLSNVNFIPYLCGARLMAFAKPSHSQC